MDERELLTQGEDQYMSEAQLAYFKQRLLDMRAIAMESIDLSHEVLHAKPVDADPLDAAFNEEVQDLTLMRVSRDMQLLKNISESFERMQSGEYGYCIETGEPIGIPRLLASPTAKTSTAILQRREIRDRLDGGHRSDDGYREDVA